MDLNPQNSEYVGMRRVQKCGTAKSASRCLELQTPVSKVMCNAAADSENSAEKSATP